MLQDLKWLILDVDGTMTDGGIYYDDYGNEMKKFNTKDATGIYVAQQVGIQIVVLTGRKCRATERRMKELKIDYLFQGIIDKKQFLENFIHNNKIEKKEIGYIGDDLNDLSSMRLSDYVGCPANSCIEVKNMANYVSKVNGGDGVVRDVIAHILQERGEWTGIIEKRYIGLQK